MTIMYFVCKVLYMRWQVARCVSKENDHCCWEVHSFELAIVLVTTSLCT